MADYISGLLTDLVEQFKGKPHITALMETVGTQLQDLADFYKSLQTDRSIQAAQGAQLDGIGDIVQLSRAEAGKLASIAFPGEPVNDETYRKYLVYKILANTNTCTYPDLIRSLRMFWDKPLYYSEDPEHPATMFLRTQLLPLDGDAGLAALLRAPLIKAAGVRIELQAAFKPAVFVNSERLLLRNFMLSFRFSNGARRPILFDGSRRFDGTWLFDQAFRGVEMRHFSVGVSFRQPQQLSGSLTTDCMWRFDGSYCFDGSRKFNAGIVKEEI